MSEQDKIVSLVLGFETRLLPGMADPSETIEALVMDGMNELRIKFPVYGNSYLDTEKLDLKFWKKRLGNEIQEYKNCITSAERKRKLANLFNLVWMAYYYETHQDKE